MGVECFIRDIFENRNERDSIAGEAKLVMAINFHIAEHGVHARPHA